MELGRVARDVIGGFAAGRPALARAAPVLLSIAVMGACIAPKGTAANPILGPGQSPTPLPQPDYVGIGKYTKVGEATGRATVAGVPALTVLEVRQPGNTSVPVTGGARFVYQEKGLTSLRTDDSDASRALEPGHAYFLSGEVDHVNPKNAEALWYEIGLVPTGARGASIPGGRVAYTSPELPTLMPGIPYTYQLGLIEMDPGGRTSSHSHGGLEVFYVLSGSVELRLAGGGRSTVATGAGAYVRPEQPMQLVVTGDQPVRIVTFFATPEGKPWHTNLQTAP